MVKLEGAEVITIEGLGTPENPHLIQEAFCLAGAIQCGFCTPGMIMAAKALLDSNHNPDEAAIKKALARNLCRCTGYKKIIEAVQLAGQFIRKETSPDEVKIKIGKEAIGESHVRPTAMIKACGLAQFNDDVPLPGGALEIAVTRSTERHARIKSIDTSAAEKMPGVVGFLRAGDIKGTNRLRQVHRISRFCVKTWSVSSETRLLPWLLKPGTGPGCRRGGESGIRTAACADDGGRIPGPGCIRHP